MKLFYLSSLLCACLCTNAKQSLSNKISDQIQTDSGTIKKGIPDGTWMTRYKDGKAQFIRTYSFEKWKQFQYEKSRYHPKRAAMPVTKLFHENRKQAEKYLNAIHTFCAIENCTAVDTNDTAHYHPPFENGLLHGAFANYFPDGTIKDTGNYKNGLPEGLWTKWTDDRQYYWKGYYQHGRKDQEWKLYSSSGKLIRILFFRDGKFAWRKEMKEGVPAMENETSGF